ncbi:COG1470 family protein [Chryseobacterium echinoideorum]|uniref:COG1470 family protein n=1 Tax=Chryseobacterium echinoideorum TaxID=1549648 RepID=UPI001184D0A2|nr:hypothetical protein [Chryseobacterium echinoideorum]
MIPPKGRKLLLNLFLSIVSVWISGQNTSSNISLEIEKNSSTSNSKILSLVIAVQNFNPIPFSGKIRYKVPKGFKVISSDETPIELKANEKIFVPVRVVIGSDAQAGISPIQIQLFNQLETLITEKTENYTVNISNELTMTVLNSNIYRSSSDEPLEIRVRVLNSGNIDQNITVVCKIPDPSNGNIFMEQHAEIPVRKDSTFVFRYTDTQNLSRGSNLIVSLSAFRNPEKEIFSTSNVLVKNIASVQKYQNPEFFNLSQEARNEITTSYRRVGENINMYQLLGAGGVNLPSGYLFMKGNIALLNSQQQPLVTNTNIQLKQGNNFYSVGSINKLLEMTLVGRGAEYSHTFRNNKKIEIGIVDQNFNLIERNSFLKYGYGFFTKGTLNAKNNSRNVSAAYIYRNDPFEKSSNHILGGEGNYTFNEFWTANGKLNAGLTSYEDLKTMKPSFSAESNYSGIIKNYLITGNYFYSSDYYPGNRRGSIQLQQNISANFKNYNYFANIIYSNFSPKFYFFTRPQISENTKIELGSKFPKIGNFNLGVIYQFQNEKSNSYNNYFGSWEDNVIRKISAHRIIEQLSWNHIRSKQSALLSVETGFAQYPSSDAQKFQIKLNANYSIKNFNFNTIYQSGSYYLSEYAFSQLTAEKVDYKKLSMSLFYNNDFYKDKLNLSTGVSYVDDVIYGKSPSAFLNTRYNSKNFSIFLNSTWYNYAVGTLASNILTFELGFTLNLKKTVLNPEKKGKVEIFAFYDENNNNLFDQDEKAAAGYLININDIALKTTSEGTALYKNVPFGKYNLKQHIQQGWYYNETEFEINQYNYPLLVPLHQNGTLQGKITFDYNTKTAVEFEHRASSVSFSIIKNNEVVQRLYSDDDGHFTSFLPTGKYIISLNESTLPSNTYSEKNSMEIEIKAGQISELPNFVIKVKEKKINKKVFSN